MTKIAKLQQWMRGKQYFASHEVIHWGDINFHNRADRDRRVLITRGKVRTITKEEKKRLGYTCKDNVHGWIGEISFKVDSWGQSLFV